MNILAIDTATEACSAALSCQGDIVERYEIAPQQHAVMLLPMVDELLAEASITPAQLDGLVLGRGPGSFTGVRIAAAAVQAIAFATECPVVTVSSLAAMAHRAWREQGITHCVALIDARMHQVYWACFETLQAGHTHALNAEQVSDPASVHMPEVVPACSWTGVGSGMHAYAAELDLVVSADNSQPPILPAAIDILQLGMADFLNGNTVAAQAAVPVYLRDNVALTEKERAQGSKL